MQMYCYHDTEENHKRLAEGHCRCQVGDTHVFKLHRMIVHGQILDPYTHNQPLGTPEVPPHFSEAYRPGQFIYAVSDDFEIRIALDCDRRAYSTSVKHETLFHNADVRAAGEIFFEDGLVVDVNDASGSYGTRDAMDTDPDFVVAILTAIDKHKIPTAPQLLEILRDRVEQP